LKYNIDSKRDSMQERATQSSPSNTSPASAIVPQSSLQDTSEPLYFSPLPIQCKLSVGAVDDPLETEADAIADKVMRMPESSFIQRKCFQCEDEETAQRKPLASFIQKKEMSGNNTVASDSVSAKIGSTRGSGNTLDTTTKSFMESRFGADFSGVRIHTGDYAAQLSSDLQAQAFTVGNDIYFNSGKYTPESSSGRYLLAHELTHTLQQGGSGKLVQRTSARVTGPNTAEVNHEGVTYRVTRVINTTIRRTIPRPRVSADANEETVSVTLSWCRDNLRGDVQLGANIPEAARQVAQQVLEAITRGAPASEISGILQGAEATPFLEVVIAQSGTFRLTARGEITLSSQSVSGGRGSLDLELGPVDVGVDVQGGTGSGISGGIHIGGTIGRRQDRFNCTSVTQRITTRYVCEQLVPEHTVPRTRTVPSTDILTKYIYFNYATDTINLAQSRANLVAIQQLLGSGYRVTEIQGFTSPEGPLARRRGSTFMGNTALAEARANAALQRLQEICTSLATTGTCASGTALSVVPLGNGELYSLPSGTVEGDPLATHATGEFMTQDAESVHRDEAMAQRLQRMTPAQQADVIYPLLRRAAIVFQLDTTRQEPYDETVPDAYTPTTCPSEVVSAAQLVFSLMRGSGR
jgi:hypothetical protein